MIKANSNKYSITTKKLRWIGVVTEVSSNGFVARTLFCNNLDKIGYVYNHLKSKDFKLIYRKEPKIKKVFSSVKCYKYYKKINKVSDISYKDFCIINDWVEECEGKTKEECSGYVISDNWLVEVVYD